MRVCRSPFCSLCFGHGLLRPARRPSRYRRFVRWSAMFFVATTLPEPRAPRQGRSMLVTITRYLRALLAFVSVLAVAGGMILFLIAILRFDLAAVITQLVSRF